MHGEMYGRCMWAVRRLRYSKYIVVISKTGDGRGSTVNPVELAASQAARPRSGSVASV